MLPALRGLTRPQRRVAWGLFVAAVGVFGSTVLLAKSGEHWHSHGGGPLGERVDSYGLFAFLRIRTAPVSPLGVGGAGCSTTWTWNGTGLLLTTACGASLAASLALAYALGVRRRLPAAYCDECGYDVRGATGERCPECGAATRTGAARPPRSERASS